jgi:hypothetical protein
MQTAQADWGASKDCTYMVRRMQVLSADKGKAWNQTLNNNQTLSTVS